MLKRKRQITSISFDEYSICAPGVRLTKVLITAPNKENNILQVDGLKAIIETPGANPNFRNFQFDPKNPSLFTGSIHGTEYTFMPYKVEVNPTEILVSAPFRGDNHERDLFVLKIPFKGTSGVLVFESGNTDTGVLLYAVTWTEGNLSSIHEWIASAIRVSNRNLIFNSYETYCQGALCFDIEESDKQEILKE